MSQLDLIESLYTRMLRIRLFEEALLRLFSLGYLRGTVHTCLGQEACAVGVVSALDCQRDTVSSNHRGHGHFLAFHDDMKGLLSEIMGLPSGVCGGIGGSQQREPDLRVFHTVSLEVVVVRLLAGTDADSRLGLRLRHERSS